MPLDLSIVGKPTAPAAFSYTWKDVVLYALGIGARRDELDYLYEGRGPRVYPSFAVVPMFAPMLDVIARTGADLSMIVHGGERVLLRKPFASSGTVHTTATARGIYDLRRFATILVDTETRDDAGEVVSTSTASIIVRDAGGFGGDPPPKERSGIDVPKDRRADFRIEESTSPEQALLYRLSGDLNPLHADPDFAKKVGFEQGPILHGLCTYGYMVRHVVKGACGGDASKLTGFEAQFRKPVWPGDTLVTEGWKVGPGQIAISLSVKERNEKVLTSAWATVAE